MPTTEKKDPPSLWVLLEWVFYEGFSEPVAVFDDQRRAAAALALLKPKYGGEWRVLEVSSLVGIAPAATRRRLEALLGRPALFPPRAKKKKRAG